MKKNNKGFTLAEMLIVVAIIGVLIAILVPSFSTQLEKARETTDAANIRSKMSEVASEAMTANDTKSGTVTIKQNTSGWEYITEIAGKTLATSSESGDIPAVDKDDVLTISCDGSGNYTFTNTAN